MPNPDNDDAELLTRLADQPMMDRHRIICELFDEVLAVVEAADADALPSVPVSGALAAFFAKLRKDLE